MCRPTPKRFLTRKCDSFLVFSFDIDDMPRGKWKLCSEPKFIVLGDGTGFIVEHTKIPAIYTFTDENPHPLHGDILIAVIDADPKNQLCEVAGFEAFSPSPVGYPKRLWRSGVATFAIIKAPSVNLKIWLSHYTILAQSEMSARRCPIPEGRHSAFGRESEPGRSDPFLPLNRQSLHLSCGHPLNLA